MFRVFLLLSMVLLLTSTAFAQDISTSITYDAVNGLSTYKFFSDEDELASFWFQNDSVYSAAVPEVLEMTVAQARIFISNMVDWRDVMVRRDTFITGTGGIGLYKLSLKKTATKVETELTVGDQDVVSVKWKKSTGICEFASRPAIGMSYLEFGLSLLTQTRFVSAIAELGY